MVKDRVVTLEICSYLYFYDNILHSLVRVESGCSRTTRSLNILMFVIVWDPIGNVYGAFSFCSVSSLGGNLSVHPTHYLRALVSGA